MTGPSLRMQAPPRYEDLQREVMMALKPDLFEGLRFEITKPLNQNFFLTHSLFMVRPSGEVG
jgi:mitochondrial import receptor subunit TOM40